jgi:arsenite methyltransferase
MGSAPAAGRASYGVDAPYVPLGLAAGAAACLLAGVGATLGLGLGSAVVWYLFAVGMSVSTWLYLRATRRGKFEVWSTLLDELALRGDEQILDAGCGRGAVLLMAAGRLSTGRAVGVDLWRKVDQSGNDQEVTHRNAVAAGVADRVELHTADMTDLPFPDGQFDVVVSSLAIHNIDSREGREQAVDEALRVLRSGGRLVLVDISATKVYRARLEERGAHDVRTRPLGWRMWWGGPWMPTTAVTATKP